mgnify:FL=1
MAVCPTAEAVSRIVVGEKSAGTHAPTTGKMGVFHNKPPLKIFLRFKSSESSPINSHHRYLPPFYKGGTIAVNYRQIEIKQ